MIGDERSFCVFHELTIAQEKERKQEKEECATYHAQRRSLLFAVIGEDLRVIRAARDGNVVVLQVLLTGFNRFGPFGVSFVVSWICTSVPFCAPVCMFYPKG